MYVHVSQETKDRILIVLGAAVGTSTTYVQPSSSPPPPPPSSTAVIIVPTTTSAPASATPTPSSSAAQPTCKTGYFSCPASLGGGCCENGRTCANGASCLGGAPSSTQAPSAPVRPTSGSVTTTSASSSSDVCPTGFYVCSAYYPSGCCRVGRDCQTTGSCRLPSETLINSNGVVIVAPTGLGVASTAPRSGGSCPSAWYSCPADRGGNCCPNGYECGQQCTATASGQSGIQQKLPPSTASFVSIWAVWSSLLTSLAVGLAMIVL